MRTYECLGSTIAIGVTSDNPRLHLNTRCNVNLSFANILSNLIAKILVFNVNNSVEFLARVCIQVVSIVHTQYGISSRDLRSHLLFTLFMFSAISLFVCITFFIESRTPGLERFFRSQIFGFIPYEFAVEEDTRDVVRNLSRLGWIGGENCSCELPKTKCQCQYKCRFL